MPSIYDVARLAGVSKSTVSRVVNYAPDVAPALREAVLKAIKQLDYKPALNRRHRRVSASPTIRTGHILMLSSWQSPGEAGESSVAPLLSTLLKGAGAAAHELHLNLLTASHVPGKPLAKKLDLERVDGVLLVGRWDGLEAQLEERIGALPAVLMMRDYGLAPQNAVRVYYDNQAVGAIAARYLLDAGHKRVAFLNAEAGHRAFAAREAAFVEVMKQSRGNVLSLQGDVSTTGKKAAARSFVEKMKRAQVFPSAVCVASDTGLPELYAALQDHGIKPQADVVIVSCNNEEGVMRDLSPRPVTIDIRADLIGRLAVQQLHWRIRHPHLHGDITVMVAPELVEP